MKIVKPKPGDLVYGKGTKDLIYVMDNGLGVGVKEPGDLYYSGYTQWAYMFSPEWGILLRESHFEILRQSSIPQIKPSQLVSWENA